MKSPAAQEKFKQGPVGLLTVFPSGPVAMPKFLGMWFVYCLLIGFFVAYLTDTRSRQYALSCGFSRRWHRRLPYFRSWTLGQRHLEGPALECGLKEAFDGFIYSLLVAGTFGWLWPR